MTRPAHPADGPRPLDARRHRPRVLAVNGLCAGFPATPRGSVLAAVDLNLAAGEILGLVGASGSGKSLLARCICRLEAPAHITAGEILLDGMDMCRASIRAAAGRRGRSVVLIPQDPRSAMDPLFRIGFQIEESLAGGKNGQPSRRRKARLSPTGDRSGGRIGDLLCRTGIGGSRRRLRQYPHQWSRGMLQRALLATAFALRPRVLLLDEVTSALDPTIALSILTLIRDLVDTHRTGVVFITHDLAQARFLCDRMAVLHDGRIVESGNTHQVFTSPDDAYTRRQVNAL